MNPSLLRFQSARRIVTPALIFLLALASLLLMAAPATAAQRMADWLVPRGFNVEVDAGGFQYPTHIAFVPHPGPGPKDPLYFVAEIRGRIKVVTNDRTVETFAEDFFKVTPHKEFPSHLAECGMGAIYLDADTGYVFASFTHDDEKGALRNGLIRFESTPGTFSLKAKNQKLLADAMLAEQPSGLSHMIGPMAAKDGLLYLSVGDAHWPEASQRIDRANGKILRMTFDGEPAPDNPFYTDGDRMKPANFVWAYGLRNPFGLKMVDGRLFAADNGPDTDRFVEVHRGENFGYDGSDWSMAAHATVVFPHAISPVQIAWHGGSGPFPAAFRDRFFIAASGSPLTPPGPGKFGEKSVVMIGYDFKNSRVTGTPTHFLRYVGEGTPLVVGAAFGPDGLYVVPMEIATGLKSDILRITYDPAKNYPHILENDMDPSHLMEAMGCYSCHGRIAGQKLIGPTLERTDLWASLREHIGSAKYLAVLDAADKLEGEPFNKFRDARRKLRDLTGDARIRAWVPLHLLDPRFDNPVSQMPNLGLTQAQADSIAAHLLSDGERSFSERIKLAMARDPAAAQAGMIVGGALAAGAALILALLVRLLVVWRRRTAKS